MRDFALLVLRLITGGLMMGHGSQKLFGWFGGHGIPGTAGWLESLNLKPGTTWAWAAGLSEFGGGLLTALGMWNPLGPLSILSAMGMASATAHRGKPIWNTEGGAELPLMNSAAALTVGISGPGRFSMDRLFGTRMPRGLMALALTTATLAVLTGATIHREGSL